MKYAPQKVFIIEENDYIELTYPEYCSRCEKDASYLKKRFLPLYGDADGSVGERLYRFLSGTAADRNI